MYKKNVKPFHYMGDDFLDKTLLNKQNFNGGLIETNKGLYIFGRYNQYKADDLFCPYVSNGILGSFYSLRSKWNEISVLVSNRILESSYSSRSKENKMNSGSIVTNSKYPSYQETVIKSAKEEIKEFVSTGISSKKEMNIGTNNMLPSNQDTVKKSAKEENKESFSTPLSTKKKCKYKKGKIFIISKKK